MLTYLWNRILGSRDKDAACEDVKLVILQFEKVADSAAECHWHSEEQRVRSYVDDAKLTIQFRAVRGSIYEMLFDLPKTTTTN